MDIYIYAFSIKVIIIILTQINFCENNKKCLIY